MRAEERQLIARKLELRDEARGLRADLAGAANGYDGVPTLLSNMLSMRRVAEQRLNDAHGRQQKKKSETEVAELTEQIESLERRLEPKRDRLSRIGAECECIDRDQRKIDEAKVMVA
jgi:hypothetical protein